MPGPRRAPPPVSSRRLTGVPRRGVVLTDPAGRCYIAALPEHGGSGVALGGDGGFHPVTPPPVTGGPTGDVIGPAGAVDEMIAVYDGVTGKLIKDGGMTIADILALIGAGGGGDVVGPASAVDDRIATFNGTTGKVIQDGGKSITEVLADADTAADAGDAATLVTANAYTDSELATHTADPDAHHGEKDSVELDAGDLHLVGDLASPGPDMVYGTDASGDRGWKADPVVGASGPLYYEPLTDGDLTQPELIFALGDVVMVAVY